MILSIILVLTATGEPARRPVVLTPIMELRGRCNGAPVPAYSDVTVDPDAQTAAALRYPSRWDSRCVEPGNLAGDSDIVLVDLRSGHEIVAGPQVPSPFPPHHLAFSWDGRTVAVVRMLGDGMRSPYGLSIWRPYSDPGTLLDEESQLQPATDSLQGTVRLFEWDGSFPAAVSSSGVLVAAFGWLSTSRVELPYNAREVESIAVLDLRSHRNTMIPLPVNLEGEASRRFFLAWSGDGTSLYAILHRAYAEWEGPVGPGFVQRAGRPDWVLYCFPVATGKSIRLGMAPPTTIGFGPDDALIVADTVRGGWGPHRAYALVPINRIPEVNLADNNAGLTFADSLPMTEVVPENDLTFESFRQVWPGRKHTYAEVVKRGTKGECTVLVELTQRISKDK